MIFDQAAVGVALIDSRSGRFLRINRHYCEMIGYTVAEMSSGCKQDITHPDDLPLDLGNMRRLLAGEIREFVMDKRYSQGWSCGLGNAERIADPGRQARRPVRMWPWCRTSPTASAEAELRLKSAALESSLAGFDIVSEEGLFLYVNAAYLRLWGYERPDEDVLGTSPAGHCADPAMPAHIMATLRAQGEGTFEFTARRRDSSTFDVLMACHMLRDERNRVLYTGSSLDISERVGVLRRKSAISIANWSSACANAPRNWKQPIRRWKPLSTR